MSVQPLHTPVDQPGAATVPAPTASISQHIAEFAANLSYKSIPKATRENAKYHVLDVVGTALAATRFDFAQHALSGLLGIAEGGKNSVIGMGVKLPLRDAVLLNGILAHGLDYDDTHPGAIVHPSGSAFPCALGVGEHIDASGKEVLTGYHTTGLAGHFGCALAAGKLFNLSAQKLTLAQGLAGSTASAVSEHRADGAWNKRMHPGWAGVGGITAASLARGGFVGTRRIYEGPDGLFHSHTGGKLAEVDLAAMTGGLGDKWYLDEVAIKPYPICHLLHACADAALALKRKHNLKPADIVKVRALLHPDTFHYVCEPAEMRRKPVSDYMAKFSVQFVVAACFVRGKFGFSELEADALNDAEILALAQRVSHDTDPESQFPKYFSGGVVVTTKDGRDLVHMEKINRGAGERALTGDEIATKFMENAELAISRPRAERIRDTLLDIEKFSARELGLLLAGQ